MMFVSTGFNTVVNTATIKSFGPDGPGFVRVHYIDGSDERVRITFDALCRLVGAAEFEDDQDLPQVALGPKLCRSQ